MQRTTGLRLSIRRAALAVLAISVLPVTAVRADDAGIAAFFRDQFGIGAEPTPGPQPSYEGPGSDGPASRPLIVRRHRRPSVRAQAKVIVGPNAPVSIYDDKTLRVGDAVMTEKGLRVFVGDHAAPYTDADFATVSDIQGMPKQVQKALLVIDKAPRS